ncbi:Uncharacterised protein [Chlamydia trachomatis]|nr:Uncharacterised protein [Chlamydia trachomatis]
MFCCVTERYVVVRLIVGCPPFSLNVSAITDKLSPSYTSIGAVIRLSFPLMRGSSCSRIMLEFSVLGVASTSGPSSEETEPLGVTAMVFAKTLPS